MSFLINPQVFVTSLCKNAPVLLNEEPVIEEVMISNKGVLGIGNCLFRFDYHEGVISPLREGNGEIKVSFSGNDIHATLNI